MVSPLVEPPKVAFLLISQPLPRKLSYKGIMKIQVTWHRPDGTKPVIETVVNPQDPTKDDEELQVGKAKAAASVYFKNKFDEAPTAQELFAVVSD
jgi:hypothetical protein